MTDGADPIDNPDFNPHAYRPPNAETMAELRALARQWRAAVEAANDVRAELDAKVIQAKDAGHSFAQIREATGLGTGTVQMILAKAGRA